MKTNLFEFPVRDQRLFSRPSIKAITTALVKAFPGATMSRKEGSLFIKTREIHDNTEIWRAVGINFTGQTVKALRVETFVPVRTSGSVTHVGLQVPHQPFSEPFGLLCGGYYHRSFVVAGSLAESYAKGEICKRCLAKVAV